MARRTRRAISTLIYIIIIVIVAALIPLHLIRTEAPDWSTTFYVDCWAPASGDGGSWEGAFQTIQEGIDAACDGDTVIVAGGLYPENIYFKGKSITVRSSNPLDPHVVATTVIHGSQAGSVVTFSGTEEKSCVLSGMTICGGRALIGGGIHGGSGTRATIRNNVIVENDAEYGAGLAYCDGRIQNNVIAANYAFACGGGLCDCSAALLNNTIIGNSAPAGGGLGWCDGNVLNCIIWGNAAADGAQLYESSVATYSCIQDWTEGGDGNICEDPCLLDPDGRDNDPETYEDNDYRLAADSPCIDAGKNEDWVWEAIDLDGNPRILFGRASLIVDMGAYEYVPALEIVTTSLPGGVEGEVYTEQLEATGGLPPYAWSIGGGNLPEGLSLDPTSGQISGTPTRAGVGTSAFVVRVTDNQPSPCVDEKTFSITVLSATAVAEARYGEDVDELDDELDDLMPEGSGWWIENNAAYAASWSRYLDLVPKYPEKRDELERKALEVLYRSRQFRLYNQLAEEFLSRCTDPEIRRQVLDWYLHSALEVPDATEEDYSKVIDIADLLAGDEQHSDRARLEEYRCLAEIRRISFPPPENFWWVKGNPLYANSYLDVLALREGRPSSEIEIIEYEALKILSRSQQYSRFCDLVEEFLPHMTTSWRHTMVLDWYLHCASCWGAGDCLKTMGIGKLLQSRPDYWDRGRIINFVFDTILRYKGAEGAYPYLLAELRQATDEKEVLMALKYSYKYPGIFEGMEPEEIARLYLSKEQFIARTKANVDAIVQLKTTAARYEAMAGRGM